jgi:hypothetical protein
MPFHKIKHELIKQKVKKMNARKTELNNATHEDRLVLVNSFQMADYVVEKAGKVSLSTSGIESLRHALIDALPTQFIAVNYWFNIKAKEYSSCEKHDVAHQIVSKKVMEDLPLMSFGWYDSIRGLIIDYIDYVATKVLGTEPKKEVM